MPTSPAFIRIKAEVLAIVRAVPPGRVTTFRAIGAHLDVMARHVAYILAQLDEEERASLPWQRVVADSGAIGRPNDPEYARRQAELLAAEGLAIGPGPAVTDLAAAFFPVDEASTGVPPGRRPNRP